MQHEPFEVEVDAQVIQEVDQALRALRMQQDKLTVSMPILKEGLKRGEEVRARLAREHGQPSS
jgi:hypothetical protein